ncbi:low molecular weight protein-tyrosine-phosphatase [Planomonospora venezuelensis]|uniref:protein-tyrosine-phosphatase n=1 Tax=Planomonospora venezuelensis TaxID=1999 RepID=A0A841DCF8_PLAVE|nr:low molecular weight protein-tyrosine-phosphatase [Planomonospora venezuelensis]MBB5965978.1 protein-tyrosine phosphatase [Planomonospora venezuelensis]GIN01268.1 low molecular weight protein-tyrosine-phosphatase [Planomonospora venezuelensis]
MTYRVCVVCLGNICRSPMAEVVLRRTLADHGLDGLVAVDSAGTGGWHRGGPMDERAAETLAEHGYDGSAHRARQFLEEWYGEVDLVLAMDRENLRALRRLAPPGADVRLFRSFDPAAPEGAEVPDPYYGGREGFTEVLEMVRAASKGLAEHLSERLRP